MKIFKEWFDQFFSAVDENLILRRRESVTIEFKETFEWGRKEFRSKIAKSAAAFANNRGGIIVFGISNKPHHVIGIKNFLEIDDSEVSTFFTTHFTPNILFERQEYEFNGVKIGLLSISESELKPIICCKDSAKTYESDIYYRYGARSSKIKAGDLIYLLREIRETENEKWMNLLGNVSRFGVSNVGLLNTASGEIVGNNNTFILDENLLKQIQVLDQYSEKTEGSPAVKIIGEIREVGKLIEKPKPIYDEDIYEAFLKEYLITSGFEYLRAICRFNTPYYPFFFFLNVENVKLPDAFETVKGMKIRSGVKNGILERIADDSNIQSKSRLYPFSKTELGQKRKTLYDKVINEEQISVESEEDCKVLFESLFSLNKGEYNLRHLKETLYHIYSKFYPFEKDPYNYTFRWSLSYLDSIEYRG